MNTNRNFTIVGNDLLASTKLNSTQKLFISYILGWQKNNLSCKVTNNNLASHFGMKYAGIRTMLNTLNKMDFFTTTQYGYRNEKGIWTSGHEIRVDEKELNEFLSNEKKAIATHTIELEISNPIENDEVVEEVKTQKMNEEGVVAKTPTFLSGRVGVNEHGKLVPIPDLDFNCKYKNDDIVNLVDVMIILGYEVEDAFLLRKHTNQSEMPFGVLLNHFSKLAKEQKYNDYKNISITQEVLDKLHNMIE
jgi:hypothetical protein